MRHGSAGRFPTRAHVILNRFDLRDDDLLGAGSESRVFAMDAGHVLRIYHDSIGWDYVEARRALYAEIAKCGLPFAVPELTSVNSWVGHIYTVEKRMPGQDFSKVLPGLSGADRDKALTSYLDVAASIGNAHFGERLYGELLASNSALRREGWRDYLWASMQRALVGGRPDLEEDVPNFEVVLASIQQRLATLEDQPVKSLVHGDYFPDNLFINDDLEICGVGDFGYSTIVGDAHMDIAAALWFLETSRTNYCPDDTTFLRRLVVQRWGEELLPILDFYRLYYSIYFSGCKADDPATYQWCAANLRALS